MAISRKNMGDLKQTKMKIEPIKTTEGGDQGSTDEETLRRLDVPGLDLILSIRKLTKIKTTYLGAFAREQYNGFIHPSFNLHNVRTYRSSSDGPNFQNIPKRDKEAMNICSRVIRLLLVTLLMATERTTPLCSKFSMTA